MVPISDSRTTSNSEQLFLNIAAYATRTMVLGPGTRAAVWVQGCPINCPGCIAPEWIPNISALQISPEELVEKIEIESVDGLTFSGGEPMQQAEGLALLARLARKIKPVSLICFTGYRYERLVSQPPNPGVHDLLGEIDVLIDGPYIEAKNDSVGLRGSSNQRIIHLTKKLQHHEFELQSRSLELSIRDGEISLIGIPTKNLKSALDQARFELSERQEPYERL